MQTRSQAPRRAQSTIPNSECLPLMLVPWVDEEEEEEEEEEDEEIEGEGGESAKCLRQRRRRKKRRSGKLI